LEWWRNIEVSKVSIEFMQFNTHWGAMNASSRVDEDIRHPHRYLDLAKSLDVALGAAIEVAHVRNVSFEGALDLLVFGENGLDRVVVVVHRG
jgi:hypothetical protein